MRREMLTISLIFLVLGCTQQITSFEECVAAGFPVMESYPRQCSDGNQTFVEEITVPPGGCQEDSDCPDDYCSGDLSQIIAHSCFMGICNSIISDCDENSICSEENQEVECVLNMENAPNGTTCSFMLLNGEGPNTGDNYSEELGINTLPMYLGHAWKFIEEEDDSWDWTNAFPEKGEYEHVVLRIGILHILAWSPFDIPHWIDLENETMLKEEYGEFVGQVMGQVAERKISVDLFLVELESNVAGINMDWNNTKIIDWIRWETELIRSYLPEARICIPLTPFELRPNTELQPIDGAREISEINFSRRMIDAGVDFDAVGFNIASGPYDDVGNWTALEDYLGKWEEVGKDIFVWAMGYPADNNGNIDFEYPYNYSEEWQSEMYVNSLRILMDNPKFIGVSLDLYDYQEYGVEGMFHWGLVSGNISEPETLYPRQSFYAVREYLENNC